MVATAYVHSEDTAGARDRSAPRRDMYLWGTIRALGETSERFLVLNLSSSGVMGESSKAFAKGCFVEVMMPGIGLVNATIAWCERGKLGAKFLRPI